MKRDNQAIKQLAEDGLKEIDEMDFIESFKTPGFLRVDAVWLKEKSKPLTWEIVLWVKEKLKNGKLEDLSDREETIHIVETEESTDGSLKEDFVRQVKDKLPEWVRKYREGRHP